MLAELPGGVQVSLRLGWEAERPTGGARRAAGLLVQVSRPEALWALRAALLHALLRNPQRCDAAPRLPPARCKGPQSPLTNLVNICPPQAHLNSQNPWRPD